MDWDWLAKIVTGKVPRTKRRLREFALQRHNARYRGIAWELTYEEWWLIWQGYLGKRGKNRGQYVMARYGDTGPYAVGNVKIITIEQNSAEQKAGIVAQRKISKK